MAEEPLKSIREHFSLIEDPRIERKKLHPLINIIVIAICGVIAKTGARRTGKPE